MRIHRDLEHWLSTQKPWLQAAAELYIEHGGWCEKDIAQLTSIIKDDNYAFVDKLDLASLTSHESDDQLHLTKISDVTGIERLGAAQPLDFTRKNLCVVYGPNGAGKSSYTRLLKAVCNKPAANELRSNVFSDSAMRSKCQLHFSKANKELSTEWQLGSNPIEDLFAVDIFDSAIADIYLRQEKELTYNPPVLTLLERLAELCDHVKGMLEDEQAKLISKLPSLPENYANTKAAERYKCNEISEIEKNLTCFFQWSEKDEEDLQKVIARLNTSDPKSHAQQLRRKKQHVEAVFNELTCFSKSFGEKRQREIIRMKSIAKEKRRIVVESNNIQAAKLEGVGTQTWRALWDAARKYSNIPYPDRKFPVVDDEALCLLCHQKLDSAAQQRMRDFDAFVQGEVEAAATKARTEYEEALNTMPRIWSADDLKVHCTAAGIVDEEIVKQIATYLSRTRIIRETLFKSKSEEADFQLTTLDKSPAFFGELQSYAGQLEAQIEQCEKDAAALNRSGLRKDRLELEAKKWASEQRFAIENELVRQRELAKYEGWKKQTSSRSISTKAKEISQTLISNAFIQRFSAELKKLGGHRLPVELVNSRTKKGVALHKVDLKGASPSKNVGAADILSEGERRVIALAAFLADVTDKPFTAPFVFDDPISSLDHEYEWRVAARLVQLAETRQVIVFTHRLSLFGMLEEAAKKSWPSSSKKRFHQTSVLSLNGVSGIPDDERIWGKPKKMLNHLRCRLDEAVKEAEHSPSTYSERAESISIAFRKMLERLIETELLNDVVKRHRRSIMTQNRILALALIKQEDCEMLDELMTRYSSYVHDSSDEAPVNYPEPDTFREDLNRLESWLTDFNKRKNQHQK